jgi:hypothetical protein
MDNKNQGTYREIPFESEAELWFLMWAFELHNKSIIKIIRRASTYQLTEGLDNHYVIINNKGKELTKRQTILRPSVYTPEFEIFWNNPSYKRFVWIGEPTKIEVPLIGDITEEGIRTLIECKSDFDFANMTRLFKNNQKFLWDKHKVFVNLVKIKEFFKKTYCPAEFLKTRTGKERKLDFEPISIEQYLND